LLATSENNAQQVREMQQKLVHLVYEQRAEYITLNNFLIEGKYPKIKLPNLLCKDSQAQGKRSYHE
jgi:hypothetical protein